MNQNETTGLKDSFRKGLIAIAPLTLTLALIYWLVKFLENLFAPLMSFILGDFYLPGMGLLTALVVLFFLGLLLNYYIVLSAGKKFEQLLERIPIFNSLYIMIKNITDFFESSPDKTRMQVVEFSFDDKIKLIGFVTRDDCSNISGLKQDSVAVYLPMSYQIGGYCIFVPRSSIKPIDMKIEKALQQSLIAWAQKTKK